MDPASEPVRERGRSIEPAWGAMTESLLDARLDWEWGGW